MKRKNSNGRGRRKFEEETSFIVSPLPGLGITEAVSAPSGVSILCQRFILYFNTSNAYLKRNRKNRLFFLCIFLTQAEKINNEGKEAYRLAVGQKMMA
jgi:hypothetical protein